MDIFRVLVDYNMRTMQEVVVSSFLNYLLCPKEDHGLGRHFVEQFFLSCGLAPEELNSIQKWRGERPPTIHVIHEWDGGADKDGKPLGRPDSLVILMRGDMAWIYGIEVKIHAQSSRNESKAESQLTRCPTALNQSEPSARSQLARYATALKKFTDKETTPQEVLDDESIRLPEKVVVGGLIYIVPGVASTWPAVVEKALDESGDVLGSMLKIITWHEIRECPLGDSSNVLQNSEMAVESRSGVLPERVEKHVLRTITMESILKRIIFESQSGEIPSADQFVLHILRSLCYAAKSDFTYNYESVGKFPDNGAYREVLSKSGQISVLEGVKKSVGRFAHEKLYARSHHTSIGIPFTRNPQKDRNNTLCRIQTVDSYRAPSTVRDRIYIELAEHDGWTDEEVSMLLTGNPDINCGRPGLKFELQSGIQYHQNGKDNEKVFVVSIWAETSANAQSDVAENQLNAFFDALCRKFEATHGKTRE